MCENYGGGMYGAKTWLRIVAGILLITSIFLNYSPWLIVGIYILGKGMMSLLCMCDDCKLMAKKRK